MQKNHFELAIEEYGKLGREAVILELKLRLLANKIPETSDIALHYSVAKIEEVLLPHLVKNSLITDLEANKIKSSRKIRNKVLHCEFESAIPPLESSSGKKHEGSSMKVIKMGQMDGDNIAEQILNAANAIQGNQPHKAIRNVSETKTKDAGIAGWLLESYLSGLLTNSSQEIYKAIQTIDRVFSEMAKQDFKKGMDSE